MHHKNLKKQQQKKKININIFMKSFKTFLEIIKLIKDILG
jgi:hypothetical protein